jgi:hypothetical protein
MYTNFFLNERKHIDEHANLNGKKDQLRKNERAGG